MPSVRDQGTVDVIAQAFTSNGRIGREALKTAGYKNKYAEHGTKVVLSNIAVKKAIAKIDAKASRKYEHNRDIAINKLYTDYDYLETGAKAGNIQAIQARTAIVRELDSISNLQSQTINNQGNGLKIVVQERAKPKLAKEISS